MLNRKAKMIEELRNRLSERTGQKIELETQLEKKENQRLKAIQERDKLERELEEVKEELEITKRRYNNHVKKSQDKEIHAKKKWLNGYPDETFEG